MSDDSHGIDVDEETALDPEDDEQDTEVPDPELQAEQRDLDIDSEEREAAAAEDANPDMHRDEEPYET